MVDFFGAGHTEAGSFNITILALNPTFLQDAKPVMAYVLENIVISRHIQT